MAEEQEKMKLESDLNETVANLGMNLARYRNQITRRNFLKADELQQKILKDQAAADRLQQFKDILAIDDAEESYAKLLSLRNTYFEHDGSISEEEVVVYKESELDVINQEINMNK